MAGLFIAGSDTEIGKTEICASLCTLLIQQSYSICIRKPVASGCQYNDDASSCEDTIKLKLATHSNDPHATITPYSYAEAVSPALAAIHKNQPLTIQMLNDCCRPNRHELLLVEGAGGLGSPIATDGINADLAKTLSLAVVLVVGSRLGCISHCVMAVNYLQNQHIPLHSIILNDISNDDQSLQANRQMIEQFCQHRIFHTSYIAGESCTLTYKWQKISQQLQQQGWQY